MESIKTMEAWESIIRSDQTTVAVFSASWCPDCHYIKPFMPEVIEQYQQLKFVEVDRDEFPDLCSDLSIMGIPSFVVFRKGQELLRFVSKLRKTKDEITKFLDRAIEVSEAMNAK